MTVLISDRTLEMSSSPVSAADVQFCFMSISFVCSAFMWLLVNYFRSYTFNAIFFFYELFLNVFVRNIYSHDPRR
jgi:hypothetical protein